MKVVSNMELVKNIKNLSLFTLIYLVFFTMPVFAKDEQPVICQKSEEYIKWENLPNEEKEKVIMPIMCDMSTVYETPTITKFNYSKVKASLPTSFDTRQTSYKTSVKNQKSTKLCWGYAATSALEMYAKKNGLGSIYLSPRHMEYCSTRTFLNGAVNEYGIDRELNNGGHYLMSANYFINNLGPIAETEMPFSETMDTINISNIQNKKVLYDVNDISINLNSTNNQKCTPEQIEDIKRLVYENGSVATTTYFDKSQLYLHPSTNAYNYKGAKAADHGILIVGWDDNYKTTNFTAYSRPENPGAWIVQNSHGTTFGNNGYYYISYEDVHICDLYMGIKDVDKYVEDNAYVHDKLGYMSASGYSNKIAYAMNVFKKEYGKEELLKEVTFAAIGTGTYKIYFKEGNGKSSTISSMTLIGSGNIEHAGYTTHKLATSKLLRDVVTDFSIVVRYEMDNSIYPVAILTSDSAEYKYVTNAGGISYMSGTGNSWHDLTEENYIASIKAFTDDKDRDLSIKTIEKSIESGKYTIKANLKYSDINLDYVSMILKDKNNNKIDVNYTISNTGVISFSLTNLVAQKYNIELYYKEDYLSTSTFEIVTSTLSSSVYEVDQTKKLIYVPKGESIATLADNINGLSTSVTGFGNAYTGLVLESYVVIVKGDVTKDGLVKMNDIMKIATYVNREVALDEYELIAGDMDNDGYVKMNDVMRIASGN